VNRGKRAQMWPDKLFQESGAANSRCVLPSRERDVSSVKQFARRVGGGSTGDARDAGWLATSSLVAYLDSRSHSRPKKALHPRGHVPARKELTLLKSEEHDNKIVSTTASTAVR